MDIIPRGFSIRSIVGCRSRPKSTNFQSMLCADGDKINKKNEIFIFFSDYLLDVLLLLEDKHVVVEKLLKLLVGQVDAELLKAVEVKDLETSNIETADERCRATVRLEGCVDFGNDPLEQALVDGLGEGLARVFGLITGFLINLNA